ncbi:MAG: NAD(P)/FAD-dependent oxidoreductase [Acidobacteriota bacterium]|nr:NAD(P)/FAD-dependent oxidoreductase [Acidobacteriota bacterium]
MSYDTIVIGGGHNGLAAATVLAKKGRKVLVLEARSVLGGLAAAHEFHPGYRSPGILWDTTRVSDVLIKALDLNSHGLTRDTEKPSVFIPDKEKGFYLHGDVDKTAAELAAISQPDAEAWRDLNGFLGRVGGVLNSLLHDLPTGVEDLSFGDFWGLARKGLALRRLGKADMLEVMRIALLATKEFLDESFETDRIKGAIATPAHLCSTTGPYSPGTNLNLLLHLCAGAGVVGGAPALAGALESAAKSAGVELRTGARVSRIRFQDQRVTGVALDGGEEIDARLVLATCDPKQALLQMVDPFLLNMKLDHGITKYRARGTSARINLALDTPLTFACRPNEQPSYARIVEGIDQLEKAFDPIKYRTFAKEPTLEIHVPSVNDATYAHGNGASAAILAHFVPYDLEGGWTDAKREELGDAVTAMLKRYAPDIEGHITAREVLTPKDLEDNYGLTHGHLHHGEHAIDQMVVRPTLETTGYRTPLQGLWLGGSGCRPGGGLTGLPGLLAARTMLTAKQTVAV